VVGGWSVVAAGLAWLVLKNDKPPLWRMAGPLAMGLALSLAGLWPGLMLNRGVDPQVVDQANVIQVFERLPHHLLPERFSPLFLARYALLFGFWLALCFTVTADPRSRRLRAFVAGTIAITAAGIGIRILAFHNQILAARFLRYYWFRVSDVFLPVGVALLVALAIARARDRRRAWGAAGLVLAMLIAGGHLSEVLWHRHDDLRAPANRNLANEADWQAMCRWIAANTPADAVFIVPSENQSFRWYADRGEVVNHKDMPQDAPSVVEWWRRQDIYRADPGSERGWRSLTELSPQALKYWGAKYRADYVICVAWPPLALPRIGPRSNTYAVYRLPREPKEEARR
jgi:hypothetical protein